MRGLRAWKRPTLNGIVHRDVKPGNILLGKDGSVKLSDFGLARARTWARSLTREGMTVRTPQYMSPEQVRSARSVDLRSDLYSLGATLYHLVTGRPPFDGDHSRRSFERRALRSTGPTGRSWWPGSPVRSPE